MARCGGHDGARRGGSRSRCRTCAVAPDLQRLFAERILELEELDPGFDDHGSSVFRVRTAREHVVVRAFRADDLDGPFWGCLHALFGIDPLVAAEAAAIYALLSAGQPDPRARAEAHGRRRRSRVARRRAHARHAADALRRAVGRRAGRVRDEVSPPSIERRFDTLGNPSGSMRYPPAEFPRRLVEALRRYAGSDPQHVTPAGVVDEMCAAAGELAPPTEGALVLADIFPPQFLHDGRTRRGDDRRRCLRRRAARAGLRVPRVLRRRAGGGAHRSRLPRGRAAAVARAGAARLSLPLLVADDEPDGARLRPLDGVARRVSSEPLAAPRGSSSARKSLAQSRGVCARTIRFIAPMRSVRASSGMSSAVRSAASIDLGE